MGEVTVLGTSSDMSEGGRSSKPSGLKSNAKWCAGRVSVVPATQETKMTGLRDIMSSKLA